MWAQPVRQAIAAAQDAEVALEKAKAAQQRRTGGSKPHPDQSQLEPVVDPGALPDGSEGEPTPPPDDGPRIEQISDPRILRAQRAVAQSHALLSRQAAGCLEILAYMDGRNIMPHEYPDFPVSGIATCRQVAKSLLAQMGSVGGRVVANQMRAELMGGVSLPSASPALVRNPAYTTDLYQLLEAHAKRGNLSADDLDDLVEAAEGVNAVAPQPLADRVRDLAEAVRVLYEEGSLATLVDAAASSDDSVLKSQLLKKASERLSGASLADLLRCQGKIRDSEFRRAVEAEIQGRFPEMSVLDLLRALTQTDEPSVRASLKKEIDRSLPKYSDVRDQMGEIVKYAGSADEDVAEAARNQLANAFQRAPIHHCLHWLGEGDEAFRKLIWAQIDLRIARADAGRRAEYGEMALRVLKHSEFRTASRGAALELLVRLEDRQAAGPLIEQLLELPRELWPKVGEALRELTGEDYGPHAQDSFAQAHEAKNQWQAWWREHSK
jgi:hypothetical protein